MKMSVAFQVSGLGFFGDEMTFFLSRRFPPQPSHPPKKDKNQASSRAWTPLVFPVSIIASFNKLLQMCLPLHPPLLFLGYFGGFWCILPSHPALGVFWGWVPHPPPMLRDDLGT